MLDALDRLREKPKHIRNQYAFWIALFVTLVIGLLWLYKLPSVFSLQNEENVDTEEPDTSGSSFFNEFGDILSGLKNIPTMFKGTIEYKNKDVERRDALESQPKTIDLNALLASSTIHKNIPDAVATKTATTTP